MRPVPTQPCLGLIHTFEGHGNGAFEATANQDPAGNWEIGWSHKLPGPTDETWTLQQADNQATIDLNKIAQALETGLGDTLISSLTEGQYAAIIDFCYNVGYGDFIGSTLCRYLKTGAMHLIPAEFMKWVYGRVNGVETQLAGLVNRRKAEVKVWLT